MEPSRPRAEPRAQHSDAELGRPLVTEPLGNSARFGCCLIAKAILLWLPFVIIVSTLYMLLVLVHQVLLLPFRILFRGQALALVMRVLAPVIAVPTALLVSVLAGEPCYGAELQDLSSFDEFLHRLGASRRKNIRRNLVQACKDIRQQGLEIFHYPAGSWRFTAEHRAVLLGSCRRHVGHAYGLSAVLLCGGPMPWLGAYIFELIFILVFPCELQEFRTADGRLASLNTRSLVGRVYFQPNYASTEEFARCGIYAYSAQSQLDAAIRLGARCVNTMPSMRDAKRVVGFQGLRVSAWTGAGCRCRLGAGAAQAMLGPGDQPSYSGAASHRTASAHTVDAASWRSGGQKGAPTGQKPTGGKRAARKKAAAAAAPAAGAPAAVPAAPQPGTRAPREKALLEARGENPQEAPHVSFQQPPQEQPKGGKRAARKRALAAAKAAEINACASGEANVPAASTDLPTSASTSTGRPSEHPTSLADLLVRIED